MNNRNGPELLRASWAANRRVCVGIDPLASRISAEYPGSEIDRVGYFCSDIVDAVAGVAGCIKPNMAFFGQFGWEGMKVLAELVKYAHEVAPDLLVIGDGKRGDIGKTAEVYKAEADAYGFDAVTVNPYLGVFALAPFLRDPNLVVFGLCKTSNPESGEFQNRSVVKPAGSIGSSTEEPLYLYVARQFMRAQEKFSHGAMVGLVAGATYPDDIGAIRKEIGPGAPILVPGIGDQSGDLEKAMKAAGTNCVVNSSGGIIFSGKIREKTIELSSGVAAALV